MSKSHSFWRNCVSLTGHKGYVDALIEMTQFDERTRSVTWETFLRHVDREEVINLFPWYCWGRDQSESPLHISQDYAVDFCRGYFCGVLVYYIEHSRIEYIFTPRGEAPEL